MGLLEFTAISGIIGIVGIMFNYVGCSVGTRLKFSNSAIMNYWCSILHNVHFVKYDVTVSFMAQVLDTLAYFVSHVLVVDTVTYFDIFR